MGLFEEPEESYINATIEQIYFENPSNFYKVMRVKVSGTNTNFQEEEIVVTGNLGQVNTGEEYRFIGTMTEHAKYGLQFQVVSYSSIKPSSEKGLIAYLSSDKFKGIGKKIAQKMVEKFGTQIIDRIMEEPKLLDEITGLSKKKKEQFLESLYQNAGLEKVMIALNQHGFGSNLSLAIYNKYGVHAMQRISEDPYQLVKDIEGIGYKKADLLAEQLGIEAMDKKRIRAAIVQVIQDAIHETGDTYVLADDFNLQVKKLLEEARPIEIPLALIAEEIIEAVDEEELQREGLRLFENSLYFAELGIARNLARLLEKKDQEEVGVEKIQEAIDKVEKRLKITYGTSQREAIIQACSNTFFLLTGGPGTGKTTVINGIVETFAELNDLSLSPLTYKDTPFPFLLAAPTGRAAKRMNETTGLPASTIHRLLGLNSGDDVKNGADELEKLQGDLLIVDEFSMVDTWLCNMLLRVIPKHMRVVFVGDKDQLPSVSPGQVFHDLLHCNQLKTLELNTIYRQGENSTIVDLAYHFKQGILPKNFTEKQPDRTFFHTAVSQMMRAVEIIVKKAMDKGYTSSDIQVLAPIYRGNAGVDVLNKLLQNIFNPNSDGEKKEVVWNETTYRIGDKVLHLVNDATQNVFNGDFGRITGIILAKESESKTDELVIAFDQEEVHYKRAEWGRITLSYCISIHKSQGSEFRMVILPFVSQYGRMLQRNLLYTAVTRSKESLILLGEISAFQRALGQEGASRKTRLHARILESFGIALEESETMLPKENFLLTLEQIEQQQIDPMIHMNKTPYDFEEKWIGEEND